MTRLLCAHGGYHSPRLAVCTPEQIEAMIADLEIGQNLVVTENRQIYPSSMTPLYTNGELVLAERLHDGSICRTFNYFDQCYDVRAKRLVANGEVYEIDITGKPGADLKEWQRDLKVFSDLQFLS